MTDLHIKTDNLMNKLDEFLSRSSTPFPEDLLDAITQVKTTLAADFKAAALNDVYRLAAKDQAIDGEIEVDDGAVVSYGEDDGNYVQAWVWVSDEDVMNHLTEQVDAFVEKHGINPLDELWRNLNQHHPDVSLDALWHEGFRGSNTDKIEFLDAALKGNLQALSESLTKVMQEAAPERPELPSPGA